MWQDSKLKVRWQGGRMAVSLIVMLVFSVLLSSCGLKRSNPLDPLGNGDVVVPDPVVNILLNTSALNQTPKTVTIRWSQNSSLNTSGYYIYRSLSYNSSYARVGDVMVNEFVHSSASDASVMPGDYYYRISAYKAYTSGILEGRKSEPIFARIPY